MLKKRSPLNVQRHSQRNNRPSPSPPISKFYALRVFHHCPFSRSLSIVPLFSVSLSPIAVIRRYTSTQLHHRAGRRSRHTHSRIKAAAQPKQIHCRHPPIIQSERRVTSCGTPFVCLPWSSGPGRCFRQRSLCWCAGGHSIRHLVSAQLNSTSPNTAFAGSGSPSPSWQP